MDNKIELIYKKDAITKQQESEILKLVPKKSETGKDRNQIIRYGSKIPYAPYNVSENIPDIFKSLELDFDFDSVTINEYYSGQKIDYHFDLPLSGNKIYVLSLLGKGDLYFKNEKQNELKYVLEPRSLCVIQDRLRWEYKHSAIAHELRYSVVFRNSKEINRAKEPYLCINCKGYHHIKDVCY